jgi:chromate transporter
MAAASVAHGVGPGELFAYFMHVGALLFGSGYVLLPVLEQDLVHARGWLTSTQLVDAIAVGQATPGPVFTTATFIGYVLGGLPLAVVATAGMFLPAFVFSALSARYIERLRRWDAARRFLAGVNAAAVALIAWVVVVLGRQVFDGWASALVCAGAAIAIFRFRINPTLVLAAAALAGLARGIMAAAP